MSASPKVLVVLNRQALESRWDELKKFLNPLQALLENDRRNV
jgi:hypothetical protein